MEFDNGQDVQPGHDITIDSSQGSEDLGAATYDSDHDGIADSVIVIDGEHEYVITDSDHDGHADSMHAYDADGNEVNPDSSAPVGDSGTDDGSSTTSDHTGSDGTTGTDSGASAHTDGTTSSSGTSSTGTDSTGTDTSGTDTSGTDSSGTAAGGHDITVTGDDGSAHSLGAPTVDLDKDGSPDTAVQHNADGSITGYTDRDGDGRADQITQIGADGKIVIAVSDGNGGWEVAATGHVDSSGALVQDSTPNPDAALTGTDSDGVTTGHAGTTSGTTGATTSGTTGADHGSIPGDTTHVAGTDSSASSNTEPGTTSQDAPGTPMTAGQTAAGDITFSEGGKDYDLGAPTADMNGDGTPDTVVTHLDDGTVIAYSDTDGDGTADQVTQLAPDGLVTIGVPDGHGGWHQAATGHLDSDGKFVPDQTTAGTTTG